LEVGTFRGFLFCSLKTGWANAHPAQLLEGPIKINLQYLFFGLNASFYL
jgi:hypothetical protein